MYLVKHEFNIYELLLLDYHIMFIYFIYSSVLGICNGIAAGTVTVALKLGQILPANYAVGDQETGYNWVSHFIVRETRMQMAVANRECLKNSHNGNLCFHGRVQLAI